MYLSKMMKVPRVESKLRVFCVKIQFRTQVSEFKRSLNTVNSACNEVQNFLKLKDLMKKILYLGNTLNQGTARGLSFCWIHGPGLAEFMHSDDLFKLTVYLKVCILSLFCSICILLDFWCSMISAVFCLAGCIYIIDYSSSQYFDNEF
ncbi:hypothetical protein ES319_A12G071700v1 [Gossypium barbadense]|uniref:FH2 domain-containing protein n=2 Tax=Gossypium TaxID=3633 RepID=A0A5J5TCX7_GOSBA|nr:hypothetical protein ES319_A12G071700v1 [Gossypium barbadense]KAB2051689.1 hypothetical protein ES319_A12G071700v1 [Gossypium barbadense]TYG89154.1 hypothetical protein ES288_A12G077000v1 [Gossypium darwinii]